MSKKANKWKEEGGWNTFNSFHKSKAIVRLHSNECFRLEERLHSI